MTLVHSTSLSLCLSSLFLENRVKLIQSNSIIYNNLLTTILLACLIQLYCFNVTAVYFVQVVCTRFLSTSIYLSQLSLWLNSLGGFLIINNSSTGPSYGAYNIAIIYITIVCQFYLHQHHNIYIIFHWFFSSWTVLFSVCVLYALYISTVQCLIV